MVVRVVFLHDLKLPTSCTPVREVPALGATTLLKLTARPNRNQTLGDSSGVATGPAISLLRQRRPSQEERIPQSLPVSPLKASSSMNVRLDTASHAAGTARQYILLRRAKPVGPEHQASRPPEGAPHHPPSIKRGSSSLIHSRLSYAAHEARRFQLSQAQHYQSMLLPGLSSGIRSGIPRAAQMVLVR